MDDFDLLCVLKTTDMENDIHELFHLVFGTEHKENENFALMKKFGYALMKKLGDNKNL